MLRPCGIRVYVGAGSLMCPRWLIENPGLKQAGRSGYQPDLHRVSFVGAQHAAPVCFVW
jgi:hypothetical protein